MKGLRKKIINILSFFLKKDIESMSIFTFRKIMLTKKNPIFRIFHIFTSPLPRMVWRPGEKRGASA